MMLADIVASCAPSPVFSPDLIRIGCAGWQGGVGVTAIARALAQQIDRLDEGARRSACEIIELAGGTVASDGLPCDMWLTSDPDGPPSSVRASAQVPVIVVGPAG